MNPTPGRLLAVRAFSDRFHCGIVACMSSPYLDLGAARTYVSWLHERFEAEDFAEFERRPDPADPVTALRVRDRSTLFLARLLVEAEPLSRLNEIHLQNCLEELQRRYPSPAETAWQKFLAGHRELDDDA
jgi:hypothetical protein